MLVKLSQEQVFYSGLLKTKEKLTVFGQLLFFEMTHFAINYAFKVSNKNFNEEKVKVRLK